MLGQDAYETDAKNRTLMNSASELTNPLEMVKKTCQALESLNSHVQDEQEIDTKNRTSTYSASKLTNPLEMIIKTIQAFESLNSDVRARS